MIIPLNAISDIALQGIIEEFVLREGTDYGSQSFSFHEKIAMVRQQLQHGSILLVFSELHQTVNLIPANQLSTFDETEHH